MSATLTRSDWSGRLTCTVGGVAVDVWVYPDSHGEPQCYTYRQAMNVDPTDGVQINNVRYFGSFQPGWSLLEGLPAAAARKFEAAEQAIFDAARDLPGYREAALQQIRYYTALNVQRRAEVVTVAEAALAEARRRYDDAVTAAAALGVSL